MRKRFLERRRLRRRASFWRVTAFVVLAVGDHRRRRLATDFQGLEGAASGGQVADIKVDGFITTRPAAVEVIERAAKASSVKAILLHIDSGGGAASGGEALYSAIRRASETKPVVAVIDGLGASAAYMTAIAADHVIARESAITGSIGVIFQYGQHRGAAAEDRRRVHRDQERAAEGRALALPCDRRPAAEAMLKRRDRRHLRLVRRARRRAPQTAAWRRRARSPTAASTAAARRSA